MRSRPSEQALLRPETLARSLGQLDPARHTGASAARPDLDLKDPAPDAAVLRQRRRAWFSRTIASLRVDGRPEQGSVGSHTRTVCEPTPRGPVRLRDDLQLPCRDLARGGDCRGRNVMSRVHLEALPVAATPVRDRPHLADVGYRPKFACHSPTGQWTTSTIGKSFGFPVARSPSASSATAAMRQSACHSVTPRAAYSLRHSPACHAAPESTSNTSNPEKRRRAAWSSLRRSPLTISSTLIAVVAGTSPRAWSASTLVTTGRPLR